MSTDSSDREPELRWETTGYVCPPEAGPAWRAAQAAGMDLSLILSLEALIRAKEAMGRLQDELAVIQLKAIREKLAGSDAPPDRLS
jgi:hypothetical protein